MPRVTQECDFTIHEDEGSVCSSVGDDVELEPRGEGEAEGLETGESLGDDQEREEELSNLGEELGVDAAAPEDADQLDNVEERIWISDDHADIDASTEQHDDQHDHSTHSETPEGTLESYDDLPAPESARGSTGSSGSYRRTSGRTDALIHAAAKAVVARLEEQRNSPDRERAEEEEAEFSVLSYTTDGDADHIGQGDESYATDGDGEHVEHVEPVEQGDQSYTTDDSDRDHAEQDYDHSYTADSIPVEDEASPRPSDAASLPVPMVDDAGGDSSSHNGADDDVFSDRSPRSSTGSGGSAGSLSSGGPDPRKLSSLDETLSQTTTTRSSPRISSISHYDYEEDDFVPTSRNTPRPAFRSPSSVKAMQMSSPPTSVYGSPRSSRRMRPMAQYSPKGRSTPPRLKRPTEAAPLVLLHVTLLPLAWPWAGVLDAAAATAGGDDDDDGLGEAAGNLRGAWRHLQSKVGDTVLERGVLLPHPQGDFEVLEERVLEALELPLRRRARILECGHYLGPSNEMMNPVDDSDSETEGYDDDGAGRTSSRAAAREGETHWCSTCRHDIKYESLGPGRVFRVKVFASNGLMKAGAWGACWREMERVDVEIEPYVDAKAQGELTRLAAEQERREEEAYMQQQQQEEEMEYGFEGEEEEEGLGDQHMDESYVGEQGDMTLDRRSPNAFRSPAPSPIRSSLQDQARSLRSPIQPRMLASPSPDTRIQERNTTVIHRSSAHVVPSTPRRELQLEERSHSVAGHRHARLLASPAPDMRAAEDERALLDRPPRHLLHSPPDAETRITERAYSSQSHREPPHLLTSTPDARARAEGRGHSSSIDHHHYHPHTPGTAPAHVAERERAHDPSPAGPQARYSSTANADAERRRRDEERLREIYGRTPPPPRSPSPSPELRRGDRADYAYTSPSPPSPSHQAHERREERRKAYQAASLPDLLLEATKVFFRDARNVAIIVLGALALALVFRGGAARGFEVFPTGGGDVPLEVETGGAGRVVAARVGEMAGREAGVVQGGDAEVGDEVVVGGEGLAEREVVRVVETVTETVKVTATATEVEVEAEVETQVEADVESERLDSANMSADEGETDVDEVDASENQLGEEPPVDPTAHEAEQSNEGIWEASPADLGAHEAEIKMGDDQPEKDTPVDPTTHEAEMNEEGLWAASPTDLAAHEAEVEMGGDQPEKDALVDLAAHEAESEGGEEPLVDLVAHEEL